MIIDELIEKKKALIKELEDKFPNDVVTLEMFLKKYDGSYYSGRNMNFKQPFINQISLSLKDFWDINLVDVNELPKIDDSIYLEIEHFPDYDYLNSIAYEMLIRTREYKILVDNISEHSDNRIKKFDQLGLDINDVYDLKKVSNYYAPEKENNTFSNSYFDITIGDIEEGIDRLIKFYISKEQIYVIDSIDKIVLNTTEIITGRTFKVASNITFENVKASFSSYYVPAKLDYQTPAYNDKLTVIDSNIPLVALNDDFLLSIEELIPNRIKGSINFNFTRPLLRFKEMPIVDVPINLNLSRKELTQLVLKLKDEFEAGTVRNPINYLYNRKYSIDDIKNIVPFQMTKKSIAEAFFIYDLYQDVHYAMLLHKQKLSKFKQLDIEKVETDVKTRRENIEMKINKAIEKFKTTYKNNKTLRKKYTQESRRDLRVSKRKLEKEKKEKISRINALYKEYSKDYHTMTVLEDLVYNKAISPYMCKQYLKFMRKHVEKLAYKELIVGVEI